MRTVYDADLLLVDDNPDLLRLLSDQLSGAGYRHIRTAANCAAVWGADYAGYENSLGVHIRHLREKIEAEPSRPRWLLTARGIGYKLAGEESR